MFKKYIPNTITISRIIMSLGFIGYFISGNIELALLLFASAGISDAIDGNLARRWKVESKFGKKADTIADKLLVISGLTLLGFKFNALMFLPCIMEAMIMGISTYAHSKGKELDVNKYGKLKAIAIMTTIPFSMLSLTNSFRFLNNSYIFNSIMNCLLVGTTFMQGVTAKKYIDQYKNYNSDNIKSYRESFEYNKNDKTLNNLKKENIEDIHKKIEFLKREKESISLKEDNQIIEENSKQKKYIK